MIEEIIKDTAISKIESVLSDVDHTISFQNVSGNKWQIVLSFDLDDSNMNEAEKLFLSELLKHL